MHPQTVKDQRLIELAELLENLETRKHELTEPIGRFNMHTWYDKYEPEEPHCGTAACAIGTACLYKPFQELGLCIKKTTRNIGTPFFQGDEGWNAVIKFFGLKYPTAEYLFSDIQYPFAEITPAHVASRIRAHVNA